MSLTIEKEATGTGTEDVDLRGPDGGAEGRRRMAGLAIGPLLLLVSLVLPPPDGMSESAWLTAGVGALLAVWWVTEAIPIPATALAPLVAFPLLGVLPIERAAAPYANPTIFLFLGGFVLALAMERWGVHRRVALLVVRSIGVEPRRVILGIMVATAFISMWVSNTATAAMMLPIGLSVVQLVRPSERFGDGRPVDFNFGVCMMLGIAFAASIGGLGTLIGTPPNALLAGYIREAYGVEIGFGQWMRVGLPLVVCSLPLAWLLLTRVVYPVQVREIPGGRAALDREYSSLGPVTRPEKWVIFVFVVTAVLWVVRPSLARWLPGLDDAGIAIAAALVLFAIPLDLRGRRWLMSWDAAARLPWGVLLLFGGGLSLAAAVGDSGLAEWIAAAVGGAPVPAPLLVLVITLVIIFLTEMTSNTATAAAFLPLVASIAVGLGENPLLFAVPAVLAASCAFMMPVATPPNAIVYGSGLVTMPQMVRAGVWLNVLFTILIVLLVYTVAVPAFGIEMGTLPVWAIPG